MRLTLAAQLITHGDKGVTIDIPELTGVCLEGIPFLKIMNPTTGDTRSLTRDEERDLEEALDEFANKRLGKQLAEYITYREL